MSKQSKKTLENVPAPTTKDATAEKTEVTKKRAKEESKNGSLFTFRADAVSTSWHHEVSDQYKYIQIAIEQPGNPNGTIICDQVSPPLLFSLAPSLQNELFGSQIVLPASAALDDDVVNDVVNAILDCAKEGKPLAMHMNGDPIRMIKIHAVLVRFGMRDEANTLLEALWRLMGSRELKLGDVSWIWDTFADPIGKRWGRNDYIAPAANEYVQMMAWQIVNMDSERKLDEEIKMAIEMEKEPRYFFDMLQARVEKFGLGRELLTSMNELAKQEIHSEQGRETNALEKSITQEQFPVYPKPTPSFPTHISSTNAPRLSQDDTSHSLNRNSVSFMKFIEPPKTSAPRSPPPAFGQPEQKTNFWGHAGSFGCRPVPNSDGKDMWESSAGAFETTTLAATTPESNSVSWGIGVPGLLQNGPSPPADTNKTHDTGQCFGVLRLPQNDIVHSSTSSSFSFGGSTSIPRIKTTPSMRSPFHLTPLSRPAPSGLDFSQNAFQTPTSSSPSYSTPSTDFQFGGGAFQAHPSNDSYPSTMQKSTSSLSSYTTSTSSYSAECAGDVSASPFGDSPFGNAANYTGANNIFGMQRPLNSGGMVRKYATAKGVRGSRKR